VTHSPEEKALEDLRTHAGYRAKIAEGNIGSNGRPSQ
jgi:hypothetical protein